MTTRPRNQAISLALVYLLALAAGVYGFTLASDAATRVCLAQAARLELTRQDTVKVCGREAAARYIVGGV